MGDCKYKYRQGWWWFWVMIAALLTITLLLPSNALANDENLDEEIDDVDKQVRRIEISRALGLLKKHMVVGRNAKIVLKTNGKHLLVDPSQQLQVVRKHAATSSIEPFRPSASTTSGTTVSRTGRLQSKNNSKRMTTPTSKTINKRTSKANTDKSNNTDFKRRTNRNSNNNNISSITSIKQLQKDIMSVAASKSATIVDSLMGSHMLEEITRIVTAIVRNKRAQSLSELCDLITETLDERFHGHWHTLAVASKLGFNQKMFSQPSMSNSVVLSQDQQKTLAHVAVDDHHKTANFYVTYDFGPTMRVYIFN